MSEKVTIEIDLKRTAKDVLASGVGATTCCGICESNLIYICEGCLRSGKLKDTNHIPDVGEMADKKLCEKCKEKPVFENEVCEFTFCGNCLRKAAEEKTLIKCLGCKNEFTESGFFGVKLVNNCKKCIEKPKKLKPVDENCLYNPVSIPLFMIGVPTENTEMYLLEINYSSLKGKILITEREIIDVDLDKIQRIPDQDYGDGGNYE